MKERNDEDRQLAKREKEQSQELSHYYTTNPFKILPYMEQKRIAIEVFLAKKFSRVFYENLMAEVPVGTLGKHKLISWINDRNTEDKEDGYGIIKRYEQSYPEHFEDGKWKAENIGILLGYACELLKDPSFFGKNKKSYLAFLDSLRNEEWWYKATSIISLKMMERLYERNGLTSEWADEILTSNFLARELMNGTGRIIGRVGKSGMLTNEDASSLQEIIEISYQDVFEKSKDSEFYRLELEIFNQFATEIKNEVEKVRVESLKGLHEQLDLF